MMRSYTSFIVALVFVMLVIVSPAYAQESVEVTPTSQPAVTTVPTQTSIKNQRMEMKDALQTMRKEAQTQKKSLMDEIKTRREEMKESIQTQKETLKAKIATIADTKKQQVIERIDTKITTFNTMYTERWGGALDFLQEKLDDLNAQIAAEEANGVNVTMAEADAAAAQTVITTAKTAVSTQAGKTYPLNIASEETLRTTIGVTVTQFKTDMQAVQRLVVAAKTAVNKVQSSLAQAKNNAVVSPTATQSAVQQ